MYISLDVETTGVDPRKDKIIEFGAIKFDLAGNTETKSFLINPGIKIPELISHITKIHDDDVKDSPSFYEKTMEIQEFIGDYPIVGHNIEFDINFLKNNDIKIDNIFFDTYTLAGIAYPKMKSLSLEVLSKKLNLTHKEKHRALDDAIAAMELFNKITKKFEGLPSNLLIKIKELAEKSNSPLKSYFFNLKSDPEKTLQDKKISIGKNHKHGSLSKKFTKVLSDNKNSLIECRFPETKILELLSSKDTEENRIISISDETFQKILNKKSIKLEKIDRPENYASKEKIEKAINKKSIEPNELTLLIKCLIWKENSNTYHLNEISLNAEERKLKHLINADPDFNTASPFKTENNYICTHSYLLEQKPAFQNLIILNIDKFIKTNFRLSTIFLTPETFLFPLIELEKIFPENETVKALLSKSTILFGYLGIILEKFDDKDEYINKSTINYLTVKTPEWQNLCDITNALIKLSGDLEKIINEESIPYLKKWKKNLFKLESLITKPELETHHIQIEKNMDFSVMIKKIPFHLGENINKLINGQKNWNFIDKLIDIGDNGKFIKSQLNLDIETPLVIVRDKNRQKKEIISDIEQTDFNEEKALLPLLEKNSGKAAIIINSRKLLDHYTIFLTQHLKDYSIKSQSTNSIKKLSDLFSDESEKSILLLTPNGWKDFSGCQNIKYLYILKVPFESPNNIESIIAQKNYSNSFTDYSVPKSTMELIKIINRSKSVKTTYIMDTRVKSKDYLKPLVKALDNL